MDGNLADGSAPETASLFSPPPILAATGLPATPPWSYEEAFQRNLGIVTPDELQRLRNRRVAIIGMGGVGGIHLITLARLGIGKFRIADPDHFDTVNFNRQYGATLAGRGRLKVEVMAELARSINPELELDIHKEAIDAENVGPFLRGADVLVDGIDFFSIGARRIAFAEARRQGIWAVTAGPIGLSTAWIAFDPKGMSFDRYFDLNDRMDRVEQLTAFSVGLTPKATHLPYTDFRNVDPSTGAAPSAGLACHLASGVASAEALKVLLGRGRLRPAPWYFQFDAYRGKLAKGYLWGGNRHPWQRLKRFFLRRRVRSLFNL